MPRDDAELQAIETARRTAEQLDQLAVEAERAGDFTAAHQVLASSGLLGARIAIEEGGLGVGQGTMLEIVRLLARADAGLAQLLQPHYGFSDAIALLPSADARKRVTADVVAGARIANGASEVGGRHGADFRTRLRRRPGGQVELTGRKYYATGSVGATWITVLGLADDDRVALAYVPADAPGVSVVDDWNGIGQRGSSSGSLVLDGVLIDDGLFIEDWSEGTRGPIWAIAGRLVHAAIDVGIAERVLAEGVAAVRGGSRVPFELPYQHLTEDPSLLVQVGAALARGRALSALLERAQDRLDAADAHPRGEPLHALRRELAAVKALAAEESVALASEVFSWTGARSSSRDLALDRFWRNARTHSLHDPVRLRYIDLAREELAAEDGGTR